MTRRRGAGKVLGGVENVTLTAGDGTQAVTFDNPFDEIPAVILTANEAITLGTATYGLWATGVTSAGFTINVQSDATEADINVGWIAIERQSSERYTDPS